MPPTTDITTNKTTSDDNIIVELRHLMGDLLDSRYDSEFCLLRWLQSTDFKYQKASHILRKHLKWRKERHLDEDCRGLQCSLVTEKYAPISIIGPNRANGDHLVVFDQCGRIDIGGVMKSVQPTQYLHQMYRNFERMQRAVVEMENKIGRQCHIYYIFDLAGLAFDPSLLGIVNGPFRVTWQLVGNHYKELIDKFIVINTPSYMNLLWAAICPFIPESAREKFVLAGKDWREDLLVLCDKDHLPERYGGSIPDENIMKDPQPVPRDLYWKPRDDYPHPNTLHKVSIPAGKHRTLVYKIDANVPLNFYSMNDNDITFAIYYSQKEMCLEDDCELVFGPIPKCALPAMDRFDYLAEMKGFYHLKLMNEASWWLSSTYSIIVFDEDGKEVMAENQNEKWIKQGAKSKK